jgi:hypothetical protein
MRSTKEKNMKILSLFIAFIGTMVAGLSDAQVEIGENTTVIFATVEEARQILTSKDEFVRRMSPFDRASRMKTDRDISEVEYLEFVGKNILAWNDAEKQKITSAFQGIQTELKSLSLPFPKKVFMVKTTGNEEGGAAYTRANAIVFPKGDLVMTIAKIRKKLCHELFHILSRANPDLREKLYASIGFAKCNEVAFPSELKSRKITNPDAPRNDHFIHLKVGSILKFWGKEHWAIPILFSSSEKYDVKRGGVFFNYLQFKFLLVERKDNSSIVKPIYDGHRPKLVGMHRISGLLEQIGKNTRYIIHPEEILADNFELLVLREPDLPSSEIIRKIEGILREKRISESRATANLDNPRHRAYADSSNKSAKIDPYKKLHYLNNCNQRHFWVFSMYQKFL